MKWGIKVNLLNKICWAVFLLAICSSLYIMYNGIGLIEGLDFGPGQYYYTDLPQWDKIFFGEKSINLGTDQPILFFTLFFLWGIICYKFLKWADKK